MYKIVILLLVAASALAAPSSKCSQVKLQEIAKNPKGWSLRKLNKEITDEILCDDELLVTYVNCYLEDSCPEEQNFSFTREQIFDNMGTRSSICKGCPRATRKQINRILVRIDQL